MIRIVTSPQATQQPYPLVVKGHQSTPASGLDEGVPSVLKSYGLDWLNVSGIHGNRLAIKPVRIDAPASVVWALASDVNRYCEFSDGKVFAKMYEDAPVEEGSQIELGLRLKLPPLKNLIFGKNLKYSRETVTINNDDMLLGWHREVPLACHAESRRWQIVVPRGPHACDYYSGLFLPALVGKVSLLGVGTEILDALQSMGAGIKNAAELTTQTP
jgi:hypothetical protein